MQGSELALALVSLISVAARSLMAAQDKPLALHTPCPPFIFAAQALPTCRKTHGARSGHDSAVGVMGSAEWGRGDEFGGASEFRRRDVGNGRLCRVPGAAGRLGQS